MSGAQKWLLDCGQPFPSDFYILKQMSKEPEYCEAVVWLVKSLKNGTKQ